jgi:hypothetical protein
MGLLPPRFSNDTAVLSDAENARRFAVKPQTVTEALYQSQADLLFGLVAGVFGFVHDPSAGARRPLSTNTRPAQSSSAQRTRLGLSRHGRPAPYP